MSDNTHHKYTILQVDPNTVFGSPHEPLSRLSSPTALAALRISIAEVGLQYPPLVTRKPDGSGYLIIDGHRRMAALQQLKWPSVPVMIAEGRPEQLFSAVCGTTKPVTSFQWLEIFLNGGTLPSGANKTAINGLLGLMGREFLVSLQKAGMSPTVWAVAGKMINYTGLGSDRKKEVLQWLYERRASRLVSGWIQAKSGQTELREAFESGRIPRLLGQQSQPAV